MNYQSELLKSVKSIKGDLNKIADSVADGHASPLRYEVENINAIDGEILSALKCGDQVVKITGAQKHLYVVSYKGKGVGEGICMTYVAAGRIETVSYDYTASGWVYNSTDVCTIQVDS